MAVFPAANLLLFQVLMNSHENNLSDISSVYDTIENEEVGTYPGIERKEVNVFKEQAEAKLANEKKLVKQLLNKSAKEKDEESSTSSIDYLNINKQVIYDEIKTLKKKLEIAGIRTRTKNGQARVYFKTTNPDEVISEIVSKSKITDPSKVFNGNMDELTLNGIHELLFSTLKSIIVDVSTKQDVTDLYYIQLNSISVELSKQALTNNQHENNANGTTFVLDVGDSSVQEAGLKADLKVTFPKAKDIYLVNTERFTEMHIQFDDKINENNIDELVLQPYILSIISKHKDYYNDVSLSFYINAISFIANDEPLSFANVITKNTLLKLRSGDLSVLSSHDTNEFKELLRRAIIEDYNSLFGVLLNDDNENYNLPVGNYYRKVNGALSKEEINYLLNGAKTEKINQYEDGDSSSITGVKISKAKILSDIKLLKKVLIQKEYLVGNKDYRFSSKVSRNDVEELSRSLNLSMFNPRSVFEIDNSRDSTESALTDSLLNTFSQKVLGPNFEEREYIFEAETLAENYYNYLNNEEVINSLNLDENLLNGDESRQTASGSEFAFDIDDMANAASMRIKLKMLFPKAEEVYVDKSKGLNPSVMMAQAMIESGYGKSELATQGNNFFGIKGKGDAGSINYATGEDTADGTHYMINADFAKYSSVEQGMAANGDLLRNPEKRGLQHDRYAGTWVENTSSYKDATSTLQKAGYATSVTYTQTLNRFIEINGLYVMDNHKIHNDELKEAK